MRKSFTVLLVVFTLTLIGCGLGGSEVKEINALLDKYEKAMVAMDAQGMLEIFNYPYEKKYGIGDEAVVIKVEDEQKELFSRRAEFLKYQDIYFALNNRDIKVSGKKAEVKCNMDIQTSGLVSLQTSNMPLTFELAKKKGQWYITQEHNYLDYGHLWNQQF